MNKLSLFGLLGLVIRRDLLLAMRRRADVLTTLIFFVMVVSLFPLGVGPEPEMLRKMASGVVWVAALLSSMLSLAAHVLGGLSGRNAGADAACTAVAHGIGAGQDRGALDAVRSCPWC